MKNPFENKADEELKIIYKEIFKSREKGLRPMVLDPYIQDVRCVYPFTVSEGQKFIEQLFWEEVARRYFELMPA